MSDSDGAEEAVETGLRMAMTGAARVGETLARVRQQHQERAAAEGAQRARDLTERMQAEMAAARTAYRGVDNPQWWDTARPEEVAAAYQTAAAWRDVDPEAARVEAHMATEVRRRYDVDVHNVDSATLGPQLAGAAEEVSRRGTLDMAEATTLLAAAERADQQAAEAEDREQEADTPEEAAEAARDVQHHQVEATGVEEQAEVSWDSAERREATARDLNAKVTDPQAVEAKMRSDVAQGRPATEATAGQKGRGTKARPGRGTGAVRQRQRGISR